MTRVIQPIYSAEISPKYKKDLRLVYEGSTNSARISYGGLTYSGTTPPTKFNNATFFNGNAAISVLNTVGAFSNLTILVVGSRRRSDYVQSLLGRDTVGNSGGLEVTIYNAYGAPNANKVYCSVNKGAGGTVWDRSYVNGMYNDGNIYTEPYTTYSICGGITNLPWIGVNFTIGRINHVYSDSSSTDIKLCAMWDRLLSAEDMQKLSSNPWELFQPLYNPIFVGLSVAISSITLVGTSNDTSSTSSVDVITTGVYGNFDLTSAGWQGVPNNINKYSNIDEVTASTSDYIMSPNIYDAGIGPLILGLNNTLASGTWEIDAEIKYSNAASDVKFTLLDSSNNPVGNSGWIPVSNTYATYTPNITTTGTASRLQIEVR